MQQSYGIKPRLFKTQNVKSRHFSAPPIYNFIGLRPGLAWAGLGLVTPSCHLNLNTVYIHCIHSGPFMAATLVQSRQLIAVFRGQRCVTWYKCGADLYPIVSPLL